MLSVTGEMEKIYWFTAFRSVCVYDSVEEDN